MLMQHSHQLNTNEQLKFQQISHPLLHVQQLNCQLPFIIVTAITVPIIAMAEVEMTSPDHFGQSHSKEVPAIVEAKLKELQVEMTKTFSGNEEAHEQAKEKCPELVIHDCLLAFLHCEVFNADVSKATCALQEVKQSMHVTVSQTGQNTAGMPFLAGYPVAGEALGQKVGDFWT